MKKTELSDQQMDRVIELRRRGFTWMGIQRDIKIDRRIVQRAFTDWEKTQSIEELKEARQQLAMEEFRRHSDSILRFNEHFVAHLDFPRAAYINYDAGGYLDVLLNKDLGDGENFTEINKGKNDPERRNRRIRWHNDLLFKALQEHTARDVRWDTLEEWKNSWNSCVSNVPHLEREAEIIVGAQPGQRERLEKMSELDRLYDKNDMKKVIAFIIVGTWLQTVETAGIPAEEEPGDAGRKHEVVIDATDPDFLINLIDPTVRKLKQSEAIKNALGEAVKAKKAAGELEEMLDPLLLRPIITRTRCFLCPM